MENDASALTPDARRIARDTLEMLASGRLSHLYPSLSTVHRILGH